MTLQLSSRLLLPHKDRAFRGQVPTVLKSPIELERLPLGNRRDAATSPRSGHSQSTSGSGGPCGQRWRLRTTGLRVFNYGSTIPSNFASLVGR